MKYEDLLTKLPFDFITPERINTFITAVQDKFLKGKKENKEVKSFDPLDEVQSECIDGALYFMLMYYRVQVMKERLRDKLADKTS